MNGKILTCAFKICVNAMIPAFNQSDYCDVIQVKELNECSAEHSSICSARVKGEKSQNAQAQSSEAQSSEESDWENVVVSDDGVGTFFDPKIRSNRYRRREEKKFYDEAYREICEARNYVCQKKQQKTSNTLGPQQATSNAQFYAQAKSSKAKLSDDQSSKAKLSEAQSSKAETSEGADTQLVDSVDPLFTEKDFPNHKIAAMRMWETAAEDKKETLKIRNPVLTEKELEERWKNLQKRNEECKKQQQTLNNVGPQQATSSSSAGPIRSKTTRQKFQPY
eukprot:GHVP01040396.1.p1 GENE.GHVP01040396.1~~GHVP01040396.1.p1  ORF type:complete len:288 (+),score=63.53 GHVP01040396.1:28-864(+)